MHSGRSKSVRLLITSTVVALTFVAASGAAPAPDPRSLALRLPDLPAGFKVKSASVKSAAAAVKEGGVSLAELKSWGYVTGYFAVFDRDVGLSDALTGAIAIESTASVYRTKPGVKKSLASSAAACSKPPARELPVGARIGDEAHLCSVVKKSGGYTFQSYVVLWRRGDLKASVLITGIKGGVSPDQAVSLARVQDKRMH